jgi:hypothetical protein
MYLFISMDRPTFYFNGNQHDEIRAGGLLLYRTENDHITYLMADYFGHYGDFGGKTDKVDKNIIGTIAREVTEETNGIISDNDVRTLIKNTKPIYVKHCKYLLYICETKKYYDPDTFGNIETFENLNRSVHWIPNKRLKDKKFLNKLNFRLRNSNFFCKVTEITKKYKAQISQSKSQSLQNALSDTSSEETIIDVKLRQMVI